MKGIANTIPIMALAIISLSVAQLGAQLNESKLRAIAQERGWQPVEKPVDADYRLLQGWVLDAVDLEPLVGANVMLMRGEEFRFGAVTRTGGHFMIQLPPDFLNSEQLQLVVSYGGQSSVKVPLVLQTDVLAVVAEVDLVLPSVLMGERLGPLVMACPTVPPDIYCIPKRMWANSGILYRPLDEWLMMHSSEIQHTGRW